MTWNGDAFGGTKLAVHCGLDLLVYLRDDKPDIPHPGTWDLPGGEREPGEAPLTTGLRELHEEFGLMLPAERVENLTCYPGARPNGLPTWFGTLEITRSEVKSVRFGDEGQFWLLMPIHAFIEHRLASAALRTRVRNAWQL